MIQRIALLETTSCLCNLLIVVIHTIIFDFLFRKIESKSGLLVPLNEGKATKDEVHMSSGSTICSGVVSLHIEIYFATPLLTVSLNNFNLNLTLG